MSSKSDSPKIKALAFALGHFLFIIQLFLFSDMFHCDFFSAVLLSPSFSFFMSSPLILLNARCMRIMHKVRHFLKEYEFFDSVEEFSTSMKATRRKQTLTTLTNLANDAPISALHYYTDESECILCKYKTQHRSQTSKSG